MSQEQNQGSSGTQEGNAGGDANEGEKKQVSYETHQRLLGQYKKAQEKISEVAARIEALETEKKNAEEAILTSKGELKTILEAREKKISELNEQLNSYKTEVSEKTKVINETRKLSAFNSKLPAPLKKPEYYAFVDLDSIVMDESGTIDQVTLEKTVQEFVKNHGEDLLQKHPGNMPNAAANGKPGLSYDEWKKLPAKEQRKRLSEVANA